MTTLARRITVGAVTSAAALGVAITGAGPAQAVGNTVCHAGKAYEPPVTVYENGGAIYDVYPGYCTDGEVPIAGWRPKFNREAADWRFGGESRVYTAYNSNGQWTSTLLRNVKVNGTYFK